MSASVPPSLQGTCRNGPVSTEESLINRLFTIRKKLFHAWFLRRLQISASFKRGNLALRVNQERRDEFD